MSDGTHIEWTDATWNPITGCSIVSPGCTNCYAMKLAGGRLQHHPSRAGLTRPSKAGPVWTGEVRFNAQWLDQPLRWKRARMVFVCAHGDLFAEGVPDEWIDQVFAVMALCPQHTFQVLTKRPARMRAYVDANFGRIADAVMALRKTPEARRKGLGPNAVGPLPHITPGDRWWPLPNVWLGTSVEDQKRADERIPELLATPAAVRWISAEPLLGPIDLNEVIPNPIIYNAVTGMDRLLDWVVVGGESGHGARPMHPDWARSLRDQCQGTGVAFFFKQWGAWASIYDRDRDDPDWRDVPKSGDWDRKRWLNLEGGQGFHGDKLNMMLNVGKNAAGRLLDGIEHNDMPALSRRDAPPSPASGRGEGRAA